jgi:hypothetical protein
MNHQSAKLPTLSHMEFHKKVIEELIGNAQKKLSRRERGSPS